MPGAGIVEIGELSTVQLDPPIHRSRTTGPNSWPVLVCGSSAEQSITKAWGLGSKEQPITS